MDRLYNHFSVNGSPGPVCLGTALPKVRGKKEMDFLVDNSDERPYSFGKHKKAIYLLGFPIRSPFTQGPKEGFLDAHRGDGALVEGKGFMLTSGRVCELIFALWAAGFTKTAL
jgi:hypothetical protein